ncbi:MAG: CVNH domain-containing protein [Novosphingobium sp.]
MIRKSVMAIALGAATLGAASAAWAQYYPNYDRDYRWDGEFPRGSWERTCRNASMDGPVLSARCDNGHGRWIWTRIDVRGCPGERIRNTWGQLTCAAGNGYGGWSGRMPRGSWGETCRGARMNGPVLTASCDNGRGRWRTTSINVNQCYNGRVKNSWGRLTCD